MLGRITTAVPGFALLPTLPTDPHVRLERAVGAGNAGEGVPVPSGGRGFCGLYCTATTGADVGSECEEA